MRSGLNVIPSAAIRGFSPQRQYFGGLPDWVINKYSLAFNAEYAEKRGDASTPGTLYFRDANFDRVGFTVSRSTTATFTNKSQLIATAAANVPRIDFLSEAKLLEELSRTNEVRDREINGAGWGGSQGGVSTSVYSSLFQDNKASEVSGNDEFSRVRFVDTGIPADSTSYCFSVYIKKSHAAFSRIVINFLPGTAITRSLSVSASGVPSDPDWNIVDFNDDWYYVWTVVANNGTNTALYYQFYADYIDGSTTSIYDAPQVEYGATYPTSYIPTAGSAVTRNADARTITTLQSGSYLGATAGTWYNSFNQVQEGDVWVLSNGTESTKLILEAGDWKLEDNGGTKTTIGSYSKGDKIAVRWSGSDIGAVLNGGSEVSTTVAYGQGYTTYSKGTIGLIETKQEIAFLTQLTVAECQTLTS